MPGCCSLSTGLGHQAMPSCKVRSTFGRPYAYAPSPALFHSDLQWPAHHLLEETPTSRSRTRRSMAQPHPFTPGMVRQWRFTRFSSARPQAPQSAQECPAALLPPTVVSLRAHTSSALEPTWCPPAITRTKWKDLQDLAQERGLPPRSRLWNIQRRRTRATFDKWGSIMSCVCRSRSLDCPVAEDGSKAGDAYDGMLDRKLDLHDEPQRRNNERVANQHPVPRIAVEHTVASRRKPHHYARCQRTSLDVCGPPTQAKYPS